MFGLGIVLGLDQLLQITLKISDSPIPRFEGLQQLHLGRRPFGRKCLRGPLRLQPLLRGVSLRLLLEGKSGPHRVHFLANRDVPTHRGPPRLLRLTSQSVLGRRLWLRGRPTRIRRRHVRVFVLRALTHSLCASRASNLHRVQTWQITRVPEGRTLALPSLIWRKANALRGQRSVGTLSNCLKSPAREVQRNNRRRETRTRMCTQFECTWHTPYCDPYCKTPDSPESNIFFKKNARYIFLEYSEL
eukprot:SAG11_NODE_1229_length_5462_cov_12.053888_2_plen_245_part_00